MKRFLTVIAIVFSIVLGSYAVSDAIPRTRRPIGTVVSYNTGGHAWDQIKIIGQYLIGNQRIALVTSESCVNGEKVFEVKSVWLNRFTGEVTVQVDGRAVTGPC